MTKEKCTLRSTCQCLNHDNSNTWGTFWSPKQKEASRRKIKEGEPSTLAFPPFPPSLCERSVFGRDTKPPEEKGPRITATATHRSFQWSRLLEPQTLPPCPPTYVWRVCTLTSCNLCLCPPTLHKRVWAANKAESHWSGTLYNCHHIWMNSVALLGLIKLQLH